MSRRHGRRRGLSTTCTCRAKTACYTTYDAAMSAVHRTPDAKRAYRGDCCGHYHITRYTEDEYAQRVAAHAEEANHEQEEDYSRYGLEPAAGAGGPGAPAVGSGGQSRLAPSPATVARIVQARSAS